MYIILTHPLFYLTGEKAEEETMARSEAQTQAKQNEKPIGLLNKIKSAIFG